MSFSGWDWPRLPRLLHSGKRSSVAMAVAGWTPARSQSMTGVVVEGRPGKVPGDAFWSGGGRSQRSLAESSRNWRPGGGSSEAWKAAQPGRGGGAEWGRPSSASDRLLRSWPLGAGPGQIQPRGLAFFRPNIQRPGRPCQSLLFVRPPGIPALIFCLRDGLAESPARAKGKSPLRVSPFSRLYLAR